MSSAYKSSKTPLLLASLLSATALLSACQTSPFAKKDPVPEPRYVPSIVLGDAQTLTIMPNRVACASALPMQCLLAKSKDGSLFQIPYDWIENFQPTLGTEYVISARPQIDEGKQSLTGYWTLQNIVSQRMVSNPQ